MNDHHRAHRHEFLDDANEAPGAPVASERGTAGLGFAGTAHKQAAGAAGLIELAGDEFGGGPAVPMVPWTWERDGIDSENDFQ